MIILQMYLIANELSWNCHSSSNFDNQKGFPNKKAAWLNSAILLGALLFWLSAHHTQVFLDISAIVPIWTPMVKQWSAGTFFLKKILQKGAKGTKTVHFLHIDISK